MKPYFVLFLISLIVLTFSGPSSVFGAEDCNVDFCRLEYDYYGGYGVEGVDEIIVTCIKGPDGATVSNNLNGEYIATFTTSDSTWRKEHTHQLTDNLVEGDNLIAIEGIDNDATGGGMVAIITVKSLPGWIDKKQQIQLETSDIKIRQNLVMDKYIIMY